MILKAASEEPALFLFDIFLLWIDILFRSQLCGQVEHMKFPTSKKKPFAENWNICWWNLTKERVWPFRKESIRSWWWERERKQNCSNLFVQITANHSIIVIIMFVLSITNQSWRFNHLQLPTFQSVQSTIIIINLLIIKFNVNTTKRYWLTKKKKKTNTIFTTPLLTSMFKVQLFSNETCVPLLTRQWSKPISTNQNQQEKFSWKNISRSGKLLSSHAHFCTSAICHRQKLFSLGNICFWDLRRC